MTSPSTHLHADRVEHGRDALTPSDVLDAASEMIAVEGLDSLTMRRLASRLGVTTPTIYWHIGNKAELYERLLERYATEIGEIRASGGSPWPVRPFFSVSSPPRRWRPSPGPG